MSTSNDKEKWNDHMLVEDARKELENFAPSTKTSRSPSKGKSAQPVPPAPKKPATRATVAEVQDDEDEAPSTPTPAPIRPSPSIQVPATPLRAIVGSSPPIQVPTTPESETTIQETQGSSFDPFQATLQAAINLIGRNKDKLANSKTAVPKNTKDEVVLDLTDIITVLKGLSSMRDNMDSIKREIREVKDTVLETTKRPPPTAPRSWAAVAATPGRIQSQTLTHRHRYCDQETDEESQKKQAQRRQDRAKLEITLMSEGYSRTKAKLNTGDYAEITAAFQKAADESTGPPVKIGGFRILKSNDIRFTCETEEEANRLRQINWEAAYEGLVLRQPRYGIVIHGVPIEDINPRIDDLNEIAEEIATRNNLKLTQLRTLRAPSKLDPMARNNSYVVLTHDREAADRCLLKGIFLHSRLYNSEKYTPQ